MNFALLSTIAVYLSVASSASANDDLPSAISNPSIFEKEARTSIVLDDLQTTDEYEDAPDRRWWLPPTRPPTRPPSPPPTPSTRNYCRDRRDYTCYK